jgi:hypothetical protein
MAYLTVKNDSDSIQKDKELYINYEKVMAGRLYLSGKVNPTC